MDLKTNWKKNDKERGNTEYVLPLINFLKNVKSKSWILLKIGGNFMEIACPIQKPYVVKDLLHKANPIIWVCDKKRTHLYILIAVCAYKKGKPIDYFFSHKPDSIISILSSFLYIFCRFSVAEIDCGSIIPCWWYLPVSDTKIMRR